MRSGLVLGSLKSAFRKPQSKTRRMFDLLLVVILLCFIGLIVVDNLRHRSLVASAETLKASLERQGLSVSGIQTSCSNPVVWTEFGDEKSKRHCSMTMFIAQDMSVSEANYTITAVNDALQKSREYDMDHETLPLLFDAPYDSPRYGMVVMQKNKKIRCGLTYNYDGMAGVMDGRHAFKILLDCDDTSWFSRSFL